MFNKIICFVVSLVIFVSVLCVPVSASGSYIEYSEYSGQAISSSVANILEGYALNMLRYRNPYSGDNYNYWCAVRVNQYQYLILFADDYSDFVYDLSNFTITLKNDGSALLYDEHLYSYTDGNRVVYQAGLHKNLIFSPIQIQLTRGYVVGNVYNTIAVEPNHETALFIRYVPYILYTLIFFLLLFVAFKFLNKRWLLP